MWNKDERDGKIGQAKGRVEQAVGALTGNKDLKVQGQVDEAAAQVLEAVGAVRREAGHVIEEIGKAIKR